MDSLGDFKINILESCLKGVDLNDDSIREKISAILDNAGYFGNRKRQRASDIAPEEPTAPYEKLLDPNLKRFTVFPIKEPKIWEMYKKQQASFWRAEEIDFSKDRADFLTLSLDEQHFVKMILAFFAASDGIVNFNLEERFVREIQNMEAGICYDFQKMMEGIHCVAPDTMILTDSGYKRIEEMADADVNVWNGKEFTPTTVRYTGESILHEVSLSNGMTLKCTPGHKWFTTGANCEREIIFTKDLLPGDIIFPYDTPAMDPKDPNIFANPYIHGFFCIFGHSIGEHHYLSVPLEQAHLLRSFGGSNNTLFKGKEASISVSERINKPKFFVPHCYSMKTKIYWIDGLMYARKIKNREAQSNSLFLCHDHLKFILDVQLLLTTMGCSGHIIKNLNEGWEIHLSSTEITKLSSYGVDERFLGNPSLGDINMDQREVKVENVRRLEGSFSTFCFNEPKEHSGIFNGILTGQSETYSMMLDEIVKEKDEKERLFNAIKTVPEIKKMADWAFRWIESDKSFAHRLVAFAFVEGVFFSGAFASIFWIKKRKSGGKMFLNGLVKSNEFISRDEGMHTDFACLLYSMLSNKLTQEQVAEIAVDAVNVAIEFTNETLKVNLIGINKESMAAYIKYVADRLLVSLGHKKIYGDSNPFSFISTIGLFGKTNFFESRPTEYQDANIGNVKKGREFTRLKHF